MTERRQIEERLRKKEQEIQTLDDKIKAAKVYVQALHDVLAMMSKDADSQTSADASLRRGSSVDQARDAILKRGKPVHLNDLVEALGRPSTRESRASLGSSLAAYVRRGEIFTRPAPNTFGLIELGHTSTEDDVDEPPSGFGKMIPPAPQSRPNSDAPDDDGIPF